MSPNPDLGGRPQTWKVVWKETERAENKKKQNKILENTDLECLSQAYQ